MNRNRFRYRSYQEENQWISGQGRDYHRGGNRFNSNYHRNRQNHLHGQRTFQSNRSSYLSRSYTSHHTNNYQSQTNRQNYHRNTNNRNRNYNYNSNYNYNNKNNNYRYNYNYNYNNNFNRGRNTNRNYNTNRYYTRQTQYPYRGDSYDSRYNYNQRRFRNSNKFNNSKRHSKPKAVIFKRKSKYRKVNPTISMVKNGNKNVLIPIMDDNSGAYKILSHNDYLHLICMFLNLNELLTKFVLLSKFYYVFIKSNDSGYVGRKIFNTCLNHSFPNFLNDMKINGNEFKTNVSYQKNIFQLLTNWKYFIQYQTQFGRVSLDEKFPRRNVDLCNLLSCSSNCSIIIYWLKRVCVMTHLCYDTKNDNE